MQAVFLGLDIVVPLMSGELLAVPKLARLYFALLSYMLDIWPARVAELPGGFVALRRRRIKDWRPPDRPLSILPVPLPDHDDAAPTDAGTPTTMRMEATLR